MKEEHIYDYIDVVERVLAFAHVRQIYFKHVEHQISYSSFFQGLEKDNSVNNRYLLGEELTFEIFPEVIHDFSDVPSFNQTTWVSQVLLQLQAYSKLTFEAIFIYLSLETIYQCFHVYHEMDFSQMNKRFDEERKKASILGRLLKQRKIKMTELSKKLDIPYDTLLGLKLGRLDIKKTSFNNVYKLASYFHVRPETIAEIEVA